MAAGEPHVYVGGMNDSSPPASLAALLPSPPTVYPGLKGTIQIWEPTPHVLVSRLLGTLTVEGAQAIVMATRRMVARTPGHVAFHDWDDMTDYDSEARSRLTNVALELKKQIVVMHILTRSIGVRMGVKAASLVLPMLRPHDDRRAFELELRRALTEKR